MTQVWEFLFADHSLKGTVSFYLVQDQFIGFVPVCAFLLLLVQTVDF